MVREYLKKYNLNEILFFDWFRSHGMNLREVTKIIERYAIDEKHFHNSHDLCHSVLEQLKRDEVELLLGPKPEIVWEQIKRTYRMVWGEICRWTRNLLQAMGIGKPTHRN